MLLSLILFLVGVLGFVLNRKNLLLLIVSIELILLSVNLIVLVMGFNNNDANGQIYSIIIIATAGAERAVGLGILVAYYRLRGSLSITRE